MCRKSIILMVLVVGAFAGLARAQLITAVAHRNTDTDAPENPQIATPLGEGAVVFVDRTHVYADVPLWLIGAEYVMLANDNKNWSAYELDITFSRNATLYVFVDNRMGGAAGGKGVAPIITGMPWLTSMGFVDIGEDIGIDESADGSINQYYSIFALDVEAGTVTIGGCTEGHGGNMLGVAALPRAGGGKAQGPMPEDGATDIPRDVILSWTLGDYAETHNVYLGTDRDDVNNASVADQMGVLVSEGQMDATYERPSVLTYGQTYSWRIDEVNAAPDSTVFKGDVWSLTVEPYAYPVENVTATASSAQANMGPENTVNGSGLDADDQHSAELRDTWLSGGTLPNWIQYEFVEACKLHELWVWNSNQAIESILGFGAKDVTIEYSLDGIAWTELADVPEFAQATSAATYAHNTTVNFGGAMAKYVKLTINATWGGGAITGLSEVRFFSIPVQARGPEP
ncbi:MAG: discoidin domain-containing protein, partial [Phycisphaerales bacterium]